LGKTLAELARIVGGEVAGDASVTISGLAGISEAKEGDITFLANQKYRSRLLESRASAVIAAESIEGMRVPFLLTPDPYLAYAKIAHFLFQKPYKAQGISNEAAIAASARIGRDASIFPLVYIGENVTTGNRVALYPGAYIGDNSVIGDDVVFYPNVTVQHKSIIGNRVVLHPGVVIGGDGFGYARDGKKSTKIPQVGFVQIDDDVEIGANSTVDRAALGKTWIKRGVKIDNLVMVAHNVVIGEDTVIVAQSGIAGSTKVGNGVVLAAQSGIVGHIKIGDSATVTAQSGLTKDIPPKSIFSGTPAVPYRNWLKSSIIINRLPELHKDFKALQKKVAALEKRLKTTERS